MEKLLNDDMSNDTSDDKSINSDDKNDNSSSNINDNISGNISDNTSDNTNDDTSDNKKNTINDCDEREAVRRQFYKNRIKKDNFKLEIDENTPQEERRRILLEYQKKHRDEAVNAARGILQEYSESEECMDIEYCKSEENIDYVEYMKYLDYMDYVHHRYRWYHSVLPKNSGINRMMLSEWMLDVPQDFTENWIMVPCPTGYRVRLISGKGQTRAYSRKGILYGVFPSALPGGNPDSDFHHFAAVDCIWMKNQKHYYILDVVHWSLVPFTNCETEFRFFWIKNKFLETPELKERNTDKNRYPILTLPNIDCNSDFNSALQNLDELHPLDGFLFYHRRALYTFGETPLVTWLKPFMLSEVLGISVPALLDMKPDDYIDFVHHVQKVKARKNQDTTKINNSMEIEEKEEGKEEV